MSEREEYLLKAAYAEGWKNAHYGLEIGRGIDSVEGESERWVNDTIADNGGTIGEFICHNAPRTDTQEVDELKAYVERLRSALLIGIEAIRKAELFLPNNRFTLQDAYDQSPSTSLKEYRDGVIEECASVSGCFENDLRDNENWEWFDDTTMQIAEAIRALKGDK